MFKKVLSLSLLMTVNLASASTYNLYHSIDRCSLQGINKAIENGADVNEMNSVYNDQINRYTPIIFAVKRSCTKALKPLIEHGADVNFRRAIDNSTALVIATRRGNVEAVQTLLLHSKDLDLSITPILNRRATAIGIAARQSFNEILKLLVNHSEEFKPITLRQLEGAIRLAEYNDNVDGLELLKFYRLRFY